MKISTRFISCEFSLWSVLDLRIDINRNLWSNLGKPEVNPPVRSLMTISCSVPTLTLFEYSRTRLGHGKSPLARYNPVYQALECYRFYGYDEGYNVNCCEEVLHYRRIM